MRYLFFTNTPAHVHLYKHVIQELSADGHDVLVLGRDYGCTTDLLDWYKLPHRLYGVCGTTRRSLLINLPKHYARIVPTAVRFSPDVVFGMGAYAAHAGGAARAPTILVLDSERTTLDHRLSRPFARAILTPAAFRKRLGDDHYVFSGFKESAYLHPDVFSLRSDIRERLDIPSGDPYAIVRFNAFGSHHDIGHEGFTLEQRREIVERLAESVHVLISDEGGGLDIETLPARPFDIHPALLHDALAHARLLVADTQTMVTEAALLGTPAIRSNSFVGDSDMGNFVELESAGLIYNLATFDEVIETMTDLLARKDIHDTWKRRRNEFISDMVNLSDLLVEVATNPNRIEGLERLRPR